MFETRKLYYDEPSALATEATILEVRASGANTDIILDRTVCYPEGGGQPCDLGTIRGISIVNAVEEGLAIVHTVEGHPDFAPGETVAVMIDAARRNDHSQQHSGQHLVSAILERKYGIHTVGFHLGSAYSTIDVTCEAMDATMIADIEAIAEGFIAEAHPFAIHVCPPEDPESFPLRKKLPEGEAIIRVVEIEGYDWVACCGTHVSSAAALRVLKILSAEKYKGNTRIYFVAGDRGIRLLKAHHAILKDIAAGLGTAAEEASSRVSTLLRRNGAMEVENASLLRERARLEIEFALQGRAVESASAPGSPAAAYLRPLLFTYADRSADAAFETAKAGAAHGVAVVAVSVPERAVCVMAPASKPAGAAAQGGAQDLAGEVFRPIALGAALKPSLQRFGGKGGGGASNFRAVFETAEAAEAFASEAVKLLG